MNRLLVSLVVLAVVPLLAADDQEEGQKAGPPALNPRVKMETSLGDIILELDAEKAPISVDNFLHYVEDGFYNGTIFHRIVQKSPPKVAIDVIQGGGYTPDMTEKKEGLRPPIKNEWNNGLKNGRGTISMARTSVPDSATSQFFINTADNDMLDAPQGGAAYAVFGKVVEGMEVVDKIRNVELTQHPKLARMGTVVPAEPVIVKSVTVLEGFKRADLAARIKAVEDAAAAADTQRAKSFEELLAKGVDESGNKVESTASGLKYVVLKAGEGSSPKPTDTVVVHYTGWLLSGGTKFDSSLDRGQPATFPLNGVIKGWTEGVGLMKVGEKRRLIIPPELAYGAQGRPRIPANSTLVFDIELLSIK